MFVILTIDVLMMNQIHPLQIHAMSYIVNFTIVFYTLNTHFIHACSSSLIILCVLIGFGFKRTVWNSVSDYTHDIWYTFKHALKNPLKMPLYFVHEYTDNRRNSFLECLWNISGTNTLSRVKNNVLTIVWRLFSMKQVVYLLIYTHYYYYFANALELSPFCINSFIFNIPTWKFIH